nr:MAG TPA: hypothetical protein [Caudoviricetes sp.]
MELEKPRDYVETLKKLEGFPLMGDGGSLGLRQPV